MKALFKSPRKAGFFLRRIVGMSRILTFLAYADFAIILMAFTHRPFTAATYGKSTSRSGAVISHFLEIT